MTALAAALEHALAVPFPLLVPANAPTTERTPTIAMRNFTPASSLELSIHRPRD